ncbi:MAG: hypothetical protein ACYTEG_17785, partial [Planctomycetota bacterium]
IETTAQDTPPQIHCARTEELLRLADERILRDFTEPERLRFADLLFAARRPVRNRPVSAAISLAARDAMLAHGGGRG